MTTLPTWTQSDATPLEIDPTTSIDDRYAMLSYLGHGGMGVVVKARDRLTGDVVALKRMAGGSRLAMAREFQVLSTLRHPHIISVLDYGFATGGDAFFTMELVEHHRNVLEAARDTDERGRVELLVQVLRALSYLHRRGVFHRDLKPSNVLVEASAGVRLVDFGIATFRGENAAVSGTLSHIAPELLRGGLPSEGSDLYAVGVLAYEMLVGEHPFRGLVGPALRSAVLEAEPALAAVSNEALRPIVGRLLGKSAEQRGRTDQLIDALIAAAQLTTSRHTPATRESFLQAASFVGREVERHALEAAVRRLIAGSGGAFVIEGESGIGKTRLLDELRTVALVEGARVVRAQAASDSANALDVWREPIRHLVLGCELDDATASTLSVLVPDLETLLGRSIEAPRPPPDDARAQLRDAIASLFEKLRAPVVIVLEDLQWAPDALEMLDDLAIAVSTLPVLVVGSLRSASRLRQLSHATRIKLGGLARTEINDLTKSMLGVARPTVVDFLDRHTEGNVFFVVETVRALAEESGSLERVGETPLPERLLTSGMTHVIARRLDALPAETRQRLAVCAVVGRDLDARLLERLLGNGALDETFGHAADAGVLEPSGNRYRFSHDKFREHLLNEMLPADRRARHADVACAVEELYGAGTATAAALAHHCRHAGLPVREAIYGAMAGKLALEQGAFGEAERLLARTLEIYDDVSASDSGDRLEILLHYGAVLRAREGWSSPNVWRVYDTVIELAGKTSSQDKIIPALHGMAMSAAFRGDLATGRALATRLATLTEEASDVVGRIQAEVILANVAKWAGDHATAAIHHGHIAERYRVEQLPLHLARYGWNPQIVAALTEAASSCIGGDPDRAVEIYRRALAVAEETANPFTIAIALQIGGWVHFLRREVPETRHYADALGELAARHGFPVFSVLADALGGWARVHAAEQDDGLAQLRRAVATQRQLGGMATTFYVSHLADACLAASAIDEAHAILDQTLADDATTQERCYHPELHRLLGRAWRARGDRARAAEAFQTALTIARTQGARLFEARAAADLAEMA
jgi:tetratricopeptide (TPR) repeat protein